MELTRLFDLLDRFEARYQKPVLFGGKVDGLWQRYSLTDYIDSAHAVAYGLMHLGIKPGDRIISITFNRPEWNFLDMGIMMCGAIHVPVYPNISNDDYHYIFNHSGARMVFVAGEELYARIKNILPQCPGIEKLFTFRNLHGFEHLGELIELGKKHPQPEALKDIKSNIQGDDVATIIYTSGTTGKPKGVMLSHRNILSNVEATFTIPKQDQGQIVLSFLPLCHVYERMLNYMFQYNGYTIYYVENIATIADAMREVKPHIIGTVPRLLESIHDKIMATGRKLKGLKRMFFFWAIGVGYRFDFSGKNPWYRMQLWLLRKLVFSKWHAALGGNLNLIVSGGAALQERLGRIFWAAGFRVVEGYGLTETSPVIAVNNFQPDGLAIGTVGPPLFNVEVRIADDGEIQTKGPHVMLGYYKDEDQTREVMTPDGWFKTGDIGFLTEKGHVKITDRKKEIFKTAAGKYIAPQVIENKLKESPFIENAMVVGENEKFPAAIISPNYFHIKTWCEVKKIAFSSNLEAMNNPLIRKRIGLEIEKVNATLGEHERLIKFELTSNSWSVDSGELTPTLKLRRKVISSKYVSLIEKIYQ